MLIMAAISGGGLTSAKSCLSEHTGVNYHQPGATAVRVLEIDSVHCRAICEEIGYRLGRSLAIDVPLPPRLSFLLEQLRRQDDVSIDAPSIAPSLDDMHAFEDA